MFVFSKKCFLISANNFSTLKNTIFSNSYPIVLRDIQAWNHKLSSAYTARYFTHVAERPIRPKTRIMVLSELINPNEISTIDWSKIKSCTIKECRDVDKVNIDAVIIDYLLSHLDLSVARLYINFLFDSGANINRGATGKILRFYYLCGTQGNLTEENKKHIIKIYDELLEKSSILDPTMCEHCIHALYLTKQWKEGLKLLGDIKLLTVPTKSAYCALISAAFANSEEEIGWQLLHEMVGYNLAPSSLPYTSWIDYCTKRYKGNDLLEGLEKLFNYCRDNDFNIEVNTARHLEDAFASSLKWKVTHVSFPKSGVCPNCHETLEKIHISPDEQKELRNVLHQNIFIGRNEFAKTSPEEIDKFLKFLDTVGPLDYIIDGLNVAYSIPNSSKDSRGNVLAQMISSLRKGKKKILVIGRKHMMDWNSTNINYIKSHASLFLTTDVSHDDPFLLYAALSFPGAKFISRDLMRGHRFLLKDCKLRNTFRRWQQGHQLSLKYADSGKMLFRTPVIYLSIPQKNGKSWHIPYNSKEVMPESFDLMENWLCLRPPT